MKRMWVLLLVQRYYKFVILFDSQEMILYDRNAFA